MLQEQEQAKDQAFVKKLLQDCTISVKLEEENRIVSLDIYLVPHTLLKCKFHKSFSY